jgi:hypothetical protein
MQSRGADEALTVEESPLIDIYERRGQFGGQTFEQMLFRFSHGLVLPLFKNPP